MNKYMVVGASCAPENNLTHYTKQRIDLLARAVYERLDREHKDVTYKYDTFDHVWLYVVEGTCVEVRISDVPGRGVAAVMGERGLLNPEPYEVADSIVITAREQNRRLRLEVPVFSRRLLTQSGVCLIFAEPENTDILPPHYEPRRCSACGGAYVAITALVSPVERWQQFTHHIPSAFAVAGCLLLCSGGHQIADFPVQSIGYWRRADKMFVNKEQADVQAEADAILKDLNQADPKGLSTTKLARWWVGR